MGNFQSGAKARLISIGSTLSAAYLITSDFSHICGDPLSFSKEARHAF